MIIGEIKKTVTETEIIYEYETILASGVHAFMQVRRPVLSAEEYERRRKNFERALQNYAEHVIESGIDWDEAVREGERIGEEWNEQARKHYEKELEMKRKENIK